MSLEYQLKAEKDKLTKKDKDVEKVKTERVKWETKVQSIEAELDVSINVFRKLKSNENLGCLLRSPKSRPKRPNILSRRKSCL